MVMKVRKACSNSDEISFPSALCASRVARVGVKD